MMEDPRNISFCTHLLFCSKNLERIGDHATNIAETVVWMVSGERMPIERPKQRSQVHRSQPITRDKEQADTMNELSAVNSREASVSRPPRILVVEDEAPLAELLAYNIKAEGFQVEHVERGDEAELRLAETPFDLVILDWILPGVSGLRSAAACGRATILATCRSLC